MEFESFHSFELMKMTKPQDRLTHMFDSKPNAIKEYYIAYFDILGYRAFFSETPEKARVFLDVINCAINGVLQKVDVVNNSVLASTYGKMHINYRVFSDNVLLCIEVGDDDSNEIARIISFMEIVCEVQRGFVLELGLFLRGGLTKGELSINQDYIYGKGIVDAVTIEEQAVHPRIVLSENIINLLKINPPFSDEVFQKAMHIEKRIVDKEPVTSEEEKLYHKILNLFFRYNCEISLINNLLYSSGDGIVSLSYLYCFDPRNYVQDSTISRIEELIKQTVPTEYDLLSKSFPDIDRIMDAHKKIIEQKLIKYSDYSSFPTQSIQNFECQEKVLKKYIWSMTYHNRMCDLYNKPQSFINTQANCESRYMKLVINVLS